MAKTIKELAREASYKAYENKPLKYENGMYQVGLSDGIEQGFEDGANAVLEEIEKFAVSTWCASSLNTISLKKKIKELKGE